MIKYKIIAFNINDSLFDHNKNDKSQFLIPFPIQHCPKILELAR